LLALPERDDVQGHVAERELAGGGRERHDRVAAVERAGREERQEVRRPGTLDRELAILAVELLTERAVAIEQHRPEAEELDLLGVVVIRHHVLEVVQAPRVR
jgi:hypothetical protein